VKWTKLRCYNCGKRWHYAREHAVYTAVQGQMFCAGYTCSHCHMTWVGVPEDKQGIIISAIADIEEETP
jgi:MinD superfamily P-loop ATPase